MKRHTIKTIAAMLGAAMLFAGCGKDNSNLIIGNWSNTAQSCDITIAGQVDIPAETICMDFTTDSVMISDMRCNCLPKWESYTLTKKDGKQIIIVGNDTHGGYVIDELSGNKMVLTSPDPSIDMNFAYTMRRDRKTKSQKSY